MSDQRLIRVLTALYCDHWLLTPDVHRTLCAIAEAHAAGGEREAAQHELAAAMQANPTPRRYSLAGRTAIVPVEGVIGRKFSGMLYESGVTSIDVLDRMLSSIEEDDEVDAVLMAFDSPGGTAMGVPEVAEHVRRMRDSKPVLAYVDGLCCSAAYWIASQASAVYATSSAVTGSIGAYMAILDRSRQAELQGVKVEMFRSGPHKGMGYPGTSLTDAQREMLQLSVDAIAAQFKAAVRDGRGRKIADDVMQGQSLGIEAAQAAGLVDCACDYGTAMRDAARLGEMSAKRKR